MAAVPEPTSEMMAYHRSVGETETSNMSRAPLSRVECYCAWRPDWSPELPLQVRSGVSSEPGLKIDFPLQVQPWDCIGWTIQMLLQQMKNRKKRLQVHDTEDPSAKFGLMERESSEVNWGGS